MVALIHDYLNSCKEICNSESCDELQSLYIKLTYHCVERYDIIKKNNIYLLFNWGRIDDGKTEAQLR